MGERERGSHRDPQRCAGRGDRRWCGRAADRPIRRLPRCERSHPRWPDCRRPRRPRAGRSAPARSWAEARAGRWNRATIDCGAPRRVTSRRTSSPPTYTSTPASTKPLGDGREALTVGQPDEREAAGVESARDDEIALRQEQSRAGVVTLVDAVGETAFVAPELRQPLVAGVIHRNEHLLPVAVSVASTGTTTSRARASRGTRRGPPPPRRSRTPAASPRRRTAAGRPGRRRSG